MPSQSPRVVKAQAKVKSIRPTRRALATPNTVASSKSSSTIKNSKVELDFKPYDHRDPFLAFNSLVRIISSLPSRVFAGAGSGSQYKLLTIDEHKLCIHLCKIVEPFLLSTLAFSPCFANSSLSSSSATNTNGIVFRLKITLGHLPTEILDRITSFIDLKVDLMAFGLTCRNHSDIVFPRHWEYRTIRAKVSMMGVWKHLCERKDLARNVRVVEILDERNGNGKKVLVPKVCQKILGVSGRGNADRVGEEVISAGSTSEEESTASSSNDHSDSDSPRSSQSGVHKRQEKYFVGALTKMTRLVNVKWAANHSPISIMDHGLVWKTLVDRCGATLKDLHVIDNKAFSPLDGERQSVKKENILVNLESLSISATKFNYGASKIPDMNRISSLLDQCPSLQKLEILYLPRAGLNTSPIATELLTCGRWSKLTSLTLSSLSCPTSTITHFDTDTSTNVTTYMNSLQTFLSAHPNIEVLKLNNMAPLSHHRRLRTPLSHNSLPKLREIHATKEIVTNILKAGCDQLRPLEVIKGVRLSGCAGINIRVLQTAIEGEEVRGGHPLMDADEQSNINIEFFRALKKHGQNVKRIELETWGDMDDIRMLAWCVPNLKWLDIGKRLRVANPANGFMENIEGRGRSGSGNQSIQGPVTNMVEWAETLSAFEKLTTMHGIRFFYEISQNALPNNNADFNSGHSVNSNSSVALNMNTNTNISMTDRSRIRKNDEIAGVLAWKCTKLRRVDYWDASSGKVIVLLRDSDFGPGVPVEGKVRWDVRRF